MKIGNLVSSCLLFLGATVSTVQAQFYAPDTDFHDPVQRIFVVEAARVLAWRENQHSGRITEVQYQVNTTTNQDTIWHIEWLNADGKTIKSAQVEYPRATLKQGADFYRQAFGQLWAAGWQKAGPMDATEIETAFWHGADEARVAREESLSRAFELQTAVSTNAEKTWVPETAGLLVHSALPGVAGHLSLDWLLIARGAAWWALAEQASSKHIPQPWAPVLFLAGREQTALETWRQNPVKGTISNEMCVGWKLWLSHPTSKETYSFAIGSHCWPLTMAMLAYDSQAYNNGDLIGEVIQPLAGTKQRLMELHNYAPFFALKTSIGGGRLTEGRWPVYQRQAWFHLLAHFPVNTGEGPDFGNELQAVTNAPARESESDSDLDASLYGFQQAVPLLKSGYAEGVGKLVPTGVASVRDLLNYGWESTGQQMGSRYKFVNAYWCVPELAKPIAETVTREVPGLTPFFFNASQAQVYNYQDTLKRIQSVDDIYTLVGWTQNPFWSEGSGNTGWLFARRCWLRPSEFEWQARSMWDDVDFNRITELTEAFRDEAGPFAATKVLKYFTSLRRDLLKSVPRSTDLTAELAGKLSQPTMLYVNAVWYTKFAPLSDLERARELEKIYWKNPDCGLEDWVVRYYCLAGDFKAARRFYTEARENFLDSVRTSNGVGQSAFVLGYLLHDNGLRQMALEDSASGSRSDMTMRIWDDAIQKDSKGLQAQVAGLIERYEPNMGNDSTGRRLQNFLPLLPALANPKDPQNQEAIHYFARDNSWYILRWIWIQNLKLSKSDAIAFLGGAEAGGPIRVVNLYLEGDVKKTAAAMVELSHKNEGQTEQLVLASYLSRTLNNESLDAGTPDLKPADAASTCKTVLSQLTK
jgi:hypothetical protein